MKTLHDGKNLLLKQDGDGTLILDVKLDGRLTTAQVREIDRVMSPAGEDTWFGEAGKRAGVKALAKKIDGPKEVPWTSRAEQSRAKQQREGGR